MVVRGGAAKTTATSLIKLTINAGQATAAPPVGPSLGQKGIKAIEFCKAFNEKSKIYLQGQPLPTKIRALLDKSYTFSIKPPATFELLRRACKFERGSTSETVAIVPATIIYEVAMIKCQDPDFVNVSPRSVFKSVLATARHVGIKVIQ